MDQRSLLLLYAAKSSGLSRRQIGAVSYPAGIFRTVTNDTNHYVDLHLSDDARSLVSVVGKTTAVVFNWLFKNGSTALTNFEHTQGARCSPDGQWVVFYAPTGIYRVRTSGGEAEMLHSSVGRNDRDPHPAARRFSVARDGSISTANCRLMDRRPA